MLPKLPISISNFKQLRTEGYLYIDKTAFAHRMLTSGEKYYFLARPRRFGKSLLVSTLYAALTSQRELFHGLAITAADYHWQLFGVIKLDFSLIAAKNAVEFNNELSNLLEPIIDQYQLNITFAYNQPIATFRKIVYALYAKFGRVAVLIDEYDSPILRQLQNQTLASEIRDELQALFRAIKGLNEQIDFVFITGVSSFSKAGLFSGLNNLYVITLAAQYSAVCGYTESEIDQYFTPYLQDWSQHSLSDLTKLRAQIKTWYNGYHFSPTTPAIYNPFSLTNAVHAQCLQNFWIQSGAPSFLIAELNKQYRADEYQLLNPETFAITPSDLGAFDIGTISLPVLMFQTGYLTITDYDETRSAYHLGYPNYEVREAAQSYLLATFTNTNSANINRITLKLWTAWNEQDITAAVHTLKTLFAQVPFPLHIPRESFYHSLFQMICSTANIDCQSEYNTSHGTIDAVLNLPKVLYIVEIKFNATAQTALQQIITKRYYEPFLATTKPIILLGINFQKAAGDFTLTYEYQNWVPKDH